MYRKAWNEKLLPLGSPFLIPNSTPLGDNHLKAWLFLLIFRSTSLVHMLLLTFLDWSVLKHLMKQYTYLQCSHLSSQHNYVTIFCFIGYSHKWFIFYFYISCPIRYKTLFLDFHFVRKYWHPCPTLPSSHFLNSAICNLWFKGWSCFHSAL